METGSLRWLSEASSGLTIEVPYGLHKADSFSDKDFSIPQCQQAEFVHNQPEQGSLNQILKSLEAII